MVIFRYFILVIMFAELLRKRLSDKRSAEIERGRRAVFCISQYAENRTPSDKLHVKLLLQICRPYRAWSAIP